MRDIKFRAWTGIKMLYSDDRDENFAPENLHNKLMYRPLSAFMGDSNDYIWMKYTGLKDKNGKEIYEFMELDGKWEVDWLKGKYILRNISTGDIVDLDYGDKYKITKEYTKV
jgi:hypothetical protein